MFLYIVSNLSSLNPDSADDRIFTTDYHPEDARAICEVVGRPSPRFVNVKTVEQQDMAGWHRIRERKVKERTALVNQIRALLSEQGIVLPQGVTHVRKQLPRIVEDLDNGLSLWARDYLSELYGELVDCDRLSDKYEARIKTFAVNNEDCKRLQKIPGVGPLTATALEAVFKSLCLSNIEYKSL